MCGIAGMIDFEQDLREREKTRVKKRLYPHPIPGQKQRFPIPDRKGENAVQAVSVGSG